MASGEECRRGVSWSDPGADLLDLIVKKLTRASDYLRFRCVCRSWRFVAKRANPRPHLPLLLLPYDPSTERRSVLSVSTKQIHTLCVPELVNKIILPASRGWLLLLDVAPVVFSC
ncbi:putative F-box protein SKIP23 [Cocos nucifera]|uniref:Putative F-box protein SKIP23 n=1 Tax=Cocos nucifera TaxID=13894 RepID=A0A8K0IDY5_COCNU|nr:putative F-box protein SKIP23 [Cocos nucifera]